MGLSARPLPERDEYVLTFFPDRGLPYRVRVNLDDALYGAIRWWVQTHGVTSC